MRKAMLIPLICLPFSLPVQAEAPDPLEAAMSRIADRFLTEQNLSLLFGLVRQSLAAAATGQPAPTLPADQSAAFESTGKELQREMLGASGALLDRMEKEIRSELRAGLLQ